MKSLFLCVVGTLLLLFGHAQQKPHYTQYVMNQYILNPRKPDTGDACKNCDSLQQGSLLQSQ